MKHLSPRQLSDLKLTVQKVCIVTMGKDNIISVGGIVIDPTYGKTLPNLGSFR